MSSQDTDVNRVQIFDTTLRDGEQSPGISLNANEKIEIAQQLARLGVDVIEAGFPIASPGDFEAVQRIAREVHGPTICGLAHAQAPDIDAAWNAIRDSEQPRIHTFISTSDIHIQHQMRNTREDVLKGARAAVAQVELAKKNRSQNGVRLSMLRARPRVRIELPVDDLANHVRRNCFEVGVGGGRGWDILSHELRIPDRASGHYMCAAAALPATALPWRARP